MSIEDPINGVQEDQGIERVTDSQQWELEQELAIYNAVMRGRIQGIKEFFKKKIYSIQSLFRDPQELRWGKK